MEIKAECGSCGQHYSVDHSYTGEQIVCPNCNQQTTVRPIAPKGPAIPTKEVQTKIRQGAAIGGWICFGIAAVVLFIPLPTWFIYAPLFFVSFILGIVALAQGRIASGITLLLVNIVGTPVLFIAALVLGIVTWGAVGAALHPAATQSQNAAISNAFSQVASAVFSGQQSTKDQAPKVTPSATTPVDNIEGAFGQKMGEKFDTDQAVNTNTMTDGTMMYEFGPANTFRSFNHYYVLITPATRKIYSIWATEGFDNEDAAQKEQSVVMTMLKQKYGPEADQNPASAMENIERIDQGNRYVMTRVTGFVSSTLTIRYNDSNLENLAEQERITNEVQHTDGTGL